MSAMSAANPAVRSCIVCGTSIEDMRPAAKTCSGTCRAEASRRRRGLAGERAVRTCVHCGGEIVGRRADAKYCGEDCKRRAAHDRTTIGGGEPTTVETDPPTPSGDDIMSWRLASLRRARGASG